jgi:hypothetical protein
MMMTHAQFSDCSAKAADFLWAAIPDIQKTWKKYNKAKRTKK